MILKCAGVFLGVFVVFCFSYQYYDMKKEIAYERTINQRLTSNYNHVRDAQKETENELEKAISDRDKMETALKEREQYIVHLHSKVKVSKKNITELEQENGKVRSLLTTVLPYELCIQLFASGCDNTNQSGTSESTGDTPPRVPRTTEPEESDGTITR